MENTKKAAREAVQNAETAISGLMWVADCLEQNGEERRAAVVRVLSQEIDEQMGTVLMLLST